MPKRTDIRTILLLGSGPIVIGQGCEFDYSGTQACKALKDEGYRIVLVNSNPATIMTDPQMSDRTYIEPITPEAVRKIIQHESETDHPIDAILPTLGGQTALNCACELFDNGTLNEFNVEMIGADREIIHRAEDRNTFKEICESLGLRVPRSKSVNTLLDALDFVETVGLPAVIRPAFTLGGFGGGIAYNAEEFRDIVSRGLAASMITQVEILESVVGWKEYELEVVRDKNDNAVVVCSVENIDAMGVHTGDSVTVAPALTLSDKEYQVLRDAALDIMRAVGVQTGGSNVQFGVNPNPQPDEHGNTPFEFVVVEMNPRVSRSSALASKATGFPIAKIAAKLAIGYTLDELRNDITGTTSACFEPSIDYVVTKMPRWTFEKFPEADETLTTQMKSVGEAMAIGRTFKESFQKVIRSMEVKRFGLGLDRNDKWLAAMRAIQHGKLTLDTYTKVPPGNPTGWTGSQSSPTGARTVDGEPIEWPINLDKLHRKIAIPCQGRLYYIRYAMKMGWSIHKIAKVSGLDPFFIDQIKQLVDFEEVLCRYQTLQDVPRDILFKAKQLGYSDAQLAMLYIGHITAESILDVRRHRQSMGIEPVYKLVDTCAAEFDAATPYYYSTYETPIETVDGSSRVDDEIRVSDTPKVIIIGGGPNRIGQGIEFDYCCVHAALAAKQMGFESVMINSNPETVSTDYDTSDLLFFEPLTMEDVLNIVERLNGKRLSQHGLSNDTQHKISEDGKASVEKQLASIGVTDARILTSIHLNPNGFRWIVETPDQRLFQVDEMAHEEPKDVTEFRNVVLSDCAVAILCHDEIRGANAISQLPSLPVDYLVSLNALANRHKLGSVAIISASAGTDGWAFDAVLADGTMREIQYLPEQKLFAVTESGWDHVDRYLEAHHQKLTPFVKQLRAWLQTHKNLVHGLIVQFGGQTPLNLAKGLLAAGAPIIGTSVDAIDRAEDRDRFEALLEKLHVQRPASGIARSPDQAVEIANRIGYPVLVRPSYVLGGRGMEICSDQAALQHYITNALRASEREDAPILIDEFLDGATEVDVDVVADYREDQPNVPGTAIVCAVMEHIEHAGVHSGDSTCTIPAYSLPKRVTDRIRSIARDLAKELKVCGLMNVQMAVRDEEIYIIEVNPRASRTVPFVGKAKHVPYASVAAKVMMGRSLSEMGVQEVRAAHAYAVKAPVFPFNKFPGVDVVLGPEMRSTGEVMGIDQSLPIAYAKALMGAGVNLPLSGGVFVSVRESDRELIVDPVRSLLAMGFDVYTTKGTGRFLQQLSLRTKALEKIQTAVRPNVLDLMADKKIQLVINTPTRTGYKTDEGRIRAAAVRYGIPMLTTATAARAAVDAIQALRAGEWSVKPMQDHANDSHDWQSTATVITSKRSPTLA
ncbi:MAG: carbamoyl-phosphate synthase large subunit [Phycisphaeraceae bacterium]|nr:carbamoyl-phosphate synthase large subunit [Phycisphaerales bacterium]MCB9860077.1 carbamoyl-phosphate synthase large subunit [Phycisphaeraceae bacterium]